MFPRNRLAAVFALLIPIAACARNGARFELVQPRAMTAAERLMTLEAGQAWYHAENGKAAYLIDLPLPGATTGAHYRLYLRLADGPGRHAIGSPVGSGGFEAGFLVHLQGRGAGWTECASGTVEVVAARQRSGELSLKFADGSMLTGRFVARDDMARVRQFERESAEAQTLLHGGG